MCLATPLRVVSLEGGAARVDASGAELMVHLDLVEGVRPGDYVLVHAGYAISSLSAEEARESLAILERLAESWTD
jgi:hydrogenase expression/formation protein HypC